MNLIYYTILVISISLLDRVCGDVRINSKVSNHFQSRQRGLDGQFPYRIPSTFGYDALDIQKRENNDQFLRSNIDNEANKRDTETEAPQDMLPCRRNDVGIYQVFVSGEKAVMPRYWNNPHDSSCEVNIWKMKTFQVAPIKLPFRCGGGYQESQFSFVIPKDLQGCETVQDQCVLQIYGHSVEPRTYAMCVDFIVRSDNQTNTLEKRQVEEFTDKETIGANNGNILSATFRPALLYHDSFDTSHVDSEYSGYRGQQPESLRDEIKAAIELQSYVGNGGLIPLGDSLQSVRNRLRAQVKRAIRRAESIAEQRNRAAQRELNKLPGERQCFEGELYGVVNNSECKRLYTNTYVTNVGYRRIMNTFAPKFAAAKLTPYLPKRKDISFGLQTPPDEFPYIVDGKKSKTPLE